MTEWILPYNKRGEKKWSVNDNLHNGGIVWGPNSRVKNINIGDIAYMYEAEPIKKIHWKCKVTDVWRKDHKIELERLCEYFLSKYLSLGNLRKNGYKGNMQGPCKLKPKLSEYIHEIDKIDTSDEELTKFAQKMPMQELEELVRELSKKNPEVRDTKTKQYKRSALVSAYVKRRAGQCCELCGEIAPFLDKDGNPYLEIHHVMWLSEGGADSIDNTVALCPNCHRKMHIVQEPKDILYLQKMLKNK